MKQMTEESHLVFGRRCELVAAASPIPMSRPTVSLSLSFSLDDAPMLRETRACAWVSERTDLVLAIENSEFAFKIGVDLRRIRCHSVHL